MPLKKPHELEEGMILAAEVTNMDGQVLFGKGVELSSRQIDILQMWGIVNVDIEGEEDESSQINLDQFSPSILEKAERIVGARFRLAKSSHPAVEIVRKICVLRTAKELKRTEGKK